MKKSYLEKDVLKKEFIKHLSHMPHNSSLCGLMTELLVERIRVEDRPELLQFIIEKWKYTSSDFTCSPMGHHKIDIEIPLMEKYREKVNIKIKRMVSSTWDSLEGKGRVEFYQELHNFIFENEMIGDNVHHQAYVLFLCCQNPMLPYCEVEKEDAELKNTDVLRSVEEELGTERLKKVTFILNHPAMSYLEKASLLNKEVESTPVECRDLFITYIVEFYETSLKIERTLRQLDKDMHLLKKGPKFPLGYSSKSLPKYRKKKSKLFGKLKKIRRKQ